MIESIRVLSHKNCGFINFHTQEEAMRAKRTLQNREIMGPGTGTVRIGFAKVPPTAAHKLPMEQESITPIPNNFGRVDDMMMYMMDTMNTNTSTFSAVVTERKLIMQEFGQNDSDGPMLDGKKGEKKKKEKG